MEKNMKHLFQEKMLLKNVGMYMWRFIHSQGQSDRTNFRSSKHQNIHNFTVGIHEQIRNKYLFQNNKSTGSIALIL